jgi:hypothetical protein
VSRRVSLPGADELFRRTSGADAASDVGTGAESGAGAPSQARRTRPPLAAAPAPVELPDEPAEQPAPEQLTPGQAQAASAQAASAQAASATYESRPRRTPSGRVRHDEKMTVYVTADELLEIEHARLVLRRTVGSAVDRGRLVRAAVAMALADLDEHGNDSELVRRLSES